MAGHPFCLLEYFPEWHSLPGTPSAQAKHRYRKCPSRFLCHTAPPAEFLIRITSNNEREFPVPRDCPSMPAHGDQRTYSQMIALPLHSVTPMPHGTTAPTAGNFDATATPQARSSRSHTTMEKVMSISFHECEIYRILYLLSCCPQDAHLHCPTQCGASVAKDCGGSISIKKARRSISGFN